MTQDVPSKLTHCTKIGASVTRRVFSLRCCIMSEPSPRPNPPEKPNWFRPAESKIAEARPPKADEVISRPPASISNPSPRRTTKLAEHKAKNADFAVKPTTDIPTPPGLPPLVENSGVGPSWLDVRASLRRWWSEH